MQEARFSRDSYAEKDPQFGIAGKSAPRPKADAPATHAKEESASRQSPGNRSAWVANTRQAQKLADPEKRTSAFDKANVPRVESLTVERAQSKKLTIGALVGGLAFFVLFIMLGHECFKAMAYRNHLDAGIAALDQGKPDLAQVEFTMSIAAFPTSTDAYYQRALAEIKRGSHGNALADFQKALDLDRSNLKAFLARASLQLKMHQYEAAVKDCTKVLAANPSFVQAYRVRANAYNHLKQFQLSIADSTTFLSKYTDQDCHRADALAKRAFAYDSKQEYKLALADYSEAIACDPNNASLHAARAIVYAQVHDWKKGLDDANLAIAAKPQDPVLYKVRGECEANLSMGTNSLQDMNNMVALRPSVETHRIRGNTRFQERDYVGSMQDFGDVLLAEPDDKATSRKYQQAKVALQAKAPQNSVVADAKAPSRVPAEELQQAEPALVSKGYKLLKEGDNDAAVQYLTAAVKQQPNDADARRYLAHALVGNHMNAEAVGQFRALAALQPFVQADKLKYAKALVACNQSVQAIGIYTSILASQPKNDEVRTTLIETLLDTGSADEAARLAAEGKDINAGSPISGKYNYLIERAVAQKSSKNGPLM